MLATAVRVFRDESTSFLSKADTLELEEPNLLNAIGSLSRHEQAQKEQQAAQQEDSTEIFARKIAKATGKTLDKEKKKTAGRVVHYTFGTLMGIVYGVSAELVPEATTGAGTAFGTLLFLGADEVAVPAFQLAPAPTETPAKDHLQHWAAHVVYGGSLELVRSLVRRFI